MPMIANTKVTIPSDREIALTREFDAPRQLVFDAYTKPELVKRWLGVQGGWTLDECEIDLRVGGTFRYGWRRGDTWMRMSGVYREVTPPERLVATEEFEQPWYEGEAVGTILFDEEDGRTTLAMTIRYATKEVRDLVLQSRMEEGVSASFELLATLLPTLG